VLERLQALRPSAGRRFAATAIDLAWVLGLPALGYVCFPSLMESWQRATPMSARGEPIVPVIVLGTLPFALVQLAWIARCSRSIGKWLMGIRVVLRWGEPAGFIRLGLVRPYFKFLLSAVLVFGSGVIWLRGYDPRGLHDRIAGTRVIRERE